MDQIVASPTDESKTTGPPEFKCFDHVSLPCRDLEEGIRFYRDVLGGELVVQEEFFAMFRIAGTRIGISSAGCTFMTAGAEYPHMAFDAGPGALVQMKGWLTACGIPSSDFWTRKGVETLMFFCDPSGNVIELFCHEGYSGVSDLARGPARGHGVTLDVDALGYSTWQLPDRP